MKHVHELHPEKIRMIVCDVDGTLLPAGQEHLSAGTIEAFRKAHEKGLKVMINTGRHYTFLQPGLFEQLPMDLIGTINGACLNRRDGEIVASHPMSEDVMNRIISAADQYGLGIGFKFADQIVSYCNFDFYMKWYVQPGSRYEKLVKDGSKTRDHHLAHGTPLGTFMITPDHALIPELEKLLPEMTFARSGERGYDVFLTSINKATSVESMLKEYDLAWENVIAFGDAGNDIPFISRAGIGVIMGNAREEFRAQADIIAPRCEEDGVAAVLKQLGII